MPVERLQTYVVGLGGDRTPTNLDAIHSLSGVLLNYGVYAQHVPGATSVNGNFEALAMTPAGVVTLSGIVDSQRSYGSGHATRLDTSWRLIDPRAIRSYLVGDFTSNALAWTSSVRLAGFQIASAFDQRTDIVTTALPQFSGSAALPSSLDLYVNQQKVYSGQVPSGPFDLRALPFVSGGDVRLVTTDVTGHQLEIRKSFYYVAQQLRKGILQYSIDVGAPRLDYGLKSFDYDRTVFASADVRYGVDGALTVEGHAETSADGLGEAGFGLVKSIGGRGALTGSFAASRYDGHTGAKYTIEGQAQVAGLRLFAGTERTIGQYFDLARVSILRSARSSGASAADSASYAASAQATILDRAGLSFTPWIDPTAISVSYNRVVMPGSTMRTGSLSLSRELGSRLSLYANGFMDFGNQRRVGLFATLNLRLGRKVNVSGGLNRDAARTGYRLQATSATGQRQGDLGWGLSDEEFDHGGAQRTGYVSYRAPQALVRAQVDDYGGQWRESAQIEGAIVAAGDGVFVANRVGDAFAIVRNAGPGVEVMQGGMRMGKTDAGGHALLPELIPYYEQEILIDPTSLPDGWEAAATQRTAVAGYRQGAVVDFGARPAHGAVLTIVRPDGAPIAAGYTVRLDGGEQAVVAYDGEVYLRGLGARNRVTIDLGPEGICAAEFAYDPKGPPQPRIGPLTCR
ncbi:fimbria/pilus outer membrane usher protein [Sphingomonas nostoxanthinifaciens]|uniref:fimbria/pilus outer membrane usher protein n=1 Tax=Sphingomonas nostoxanthinifaciens TaxID=2872652 RepID=UPI001CC2031F|nr:fimbria/pilus outer membrane usher protein [Sphingomonas nostoxanthinifaciens]UAK22991.1 fimbria/pilus outer membrane usher protein [Sphingomonas nostoxanthinifaciens]